MRRGVSRVSVRLWDLTRLSGVYWRNVMTEDDMRAAEDRLRAIANGLMLVLDCVLLVCKIFWEHKIKSKLIRDKTDDLLELRWQLKSITEELK